MNNRNGAIKTEQKSGIQNHLDPEGQTDASQREGVEEQDTSAMDVKKWLFGLIVVIGIAVSWVGATQLAQSTYSEDFFAPSFNVWFSTVWMFVCYPVYIVGAMVLSPKNRSWTGIKKLNRFVKLIIHMKVSTIFTKATICKTAEHILQAL